MPLTNGEQLFEAASSTGDWESAATALLTDLASTRQQLTALQSDLQTESRLADKRSLSEYAQGECFAKANVAKRLEAIFKGKALNQLGGEA